MGYGCWDSFSFDFEHKWNSIWFRKFKEICQFDSFQFDLKEEIEEFSQMYSATRSVALTVCVQIPNTETTLRPFGHDSVLYLCMMPPPLCHTRPRPQTYILQSSEGIIYYDCWRGSLPPKKCRIKIVVFIIVHNNHVVFM